MQGYAEIVNQQQREYIITESTLLKVLGFG